MTKNIEDLTMREQFNEGFYAFDQVHFQEGNSIFSKRNCYSGVLDFNINCVLTLNGLFKKNNNDPTYPKIDEDGGYPIGDENFFIKNEKNLGPLYLLSFDRKILIVVDKFFVYAYQQIFKNPSKVSIVVQRFRICNIRAKEITTDDHEDYFVIFDRNICSDRFIKFMLKIDYLESFMNFKHINYIVEDSIKGFKSEIEKNSKIYNFEHKKNKYELIIKSQMIGLKPARVLVEPYQLKVLFPCKIEIKCLDFDLDMIEIKKLSNLLEPFFQLLMNKPSKVIQIILDNDENNKYNLIEPSQFPKLSSSENLNDILFRFNKINNFQNHLEIWFENEKLQNLAKIYLRIWYHPSSPSIDLMAITAAIESYFQKGGNSLKTRLQDIFNTVSDISCSLTSRKDDIIEKLYFYRNYFGHGHLKNKGKYIEDEQEVVHELRILLIVVYAHILKKLGFSNTPEYNYFFKNTIDFYVSNL